MKHLHRQSIHPLKIENHCEVLIPINEDVAGVEVGELKQKGLAADLLSVLVIECVKQCPDNYPFSQSVTMKPAFGLRRKSDLETRACQIYIIWCS